MAQITIYLDEGTDALLKAAVRASGMSQSRWIAEAVRERARREWPRSVAALAGAWRDFPMAEEIRENSGKDAAREPL